MIVFSAMCISFNTQPVPNSLTTLQLAWAGEDRLVVSTNAGLQLYDRRGELLAFHPEDFGLSISCPPSGSFARYIHNNLSVRDWNREKQTVTPVAEIEGFEVFDGKFDRQGKYVCGGESRNMDDYGIAAVYNVQGEMLERYEIMFRVKHLSLSPDQSKIAFCTNHGYIFIHSYPEMRADEGLVLQLEDTVMAAAWSASGRYLAVAPVHGWMQIWDLTTKERVDSGFSKIQYVGWDQWYTRMAFAPGSDELVIAGNRDTCLVDWRQGRIVRSKDGICFAISPSGQSIAVGFSDGRVMICSLEEYLLKEDS